MKLTIYTELLSQALSKVSKCATNNKMLPLTCMTNIKVDAVGVHVIATTGSDFIDYVIPTSNKEEFNVVVDNEVFYRLVTKTTSLEITLEVIDHFLKFKGNGNYTIELPVDENGDLIKFPTPKQASTLVGNITQQDLQIVNKINRANLSANMSEPCYTNFYLGNQIITSDRSVICCTNVNVLDTPVLINSIVMNLLDTDVLMYKDENIITFVGANYAVYTKCSEGIEEFDADAINALATTPLDFKFSISKQELLTALDRLGLFVTPFDKNCLVVQVTKDNLLLSNMKISSGESIVIKTTHDFKFNIDIEMFRKIVNAMNNSVFEVQFGSDLFIKLVTDEVVEIVPLLVE